MLPTGKKDSPWWDSLWLAFSRWHGFDGFLFPSSLCLSTTMSILTGARNFIIKDSNLIQLNNYGRSGESPSFPHRWNVVQSNTRYWCPSWSLYSRSSLGLIGTLWSSVLPWHSGTIHHRHHKLGYRVCQHALVHVLDERTGWCREIGHCSNMRRKAQGNWTPWCYILLYCQQTLWSFVLVHYHCLPTLNYASWLPCCCWTQDSRRQHNCWEENIISI